MFKPGDRIIFKHPNFESCTGTVAKIENPFGTMIHILMWPDTPHISFGTPKNNSVNGKNTYRFEAQNCTLIPTIMGPPIPEHIKQQQLIQTKCRKLWTKSNWVQKHPTFAY